MEKVIFLSVLIGLTQVSFAQDNAISKKPVKIEGCVYADIIYSPGEKHRVQQSVTDPVTKKIATVDVKPEILQECVEDITAEQTKSPRFYWRTL